MPGQQRRGGPRPGTGSGARSSGSRSVPGGSSRAGSRTSGDQASQPRSARLGAPRAAAPRLGTARPTRVSAPRPVSRPAVARRPAGTGTVKWAQARQPNRFTGRATVLVLVLGALLLAYAYPVRIYLNQQAEIAALRQRQRDQRAHIVNLEAESARWNDPAYIKAQARSRLQMGEPGETIYVVVGGEASGSTDPSTGKVKNTGPWYGQLWSSLIAADQPRSTK